MGSAANRLRRVGEGQTAKWHYHGIFAFTGAGVTKTVNVPMSRVEDVQLTYIGAPAATEGPMSWNNTIAGTVGDDTAAMVGTNGNCAIVVTRPAGTTAGIKFSLHATGRK